MEEEGWQGVKIVLLMEEEGWQGVKIVLLKGGKGLNEFQRQNTRFARG